MDKDEKLLVAVLVVGGSAVALAYFTRSKWLPYVEQKFSEIRSLAKTEKAGKEHNPVWRVAR